MLHCPECPIRPFPKTCDAWRSRTRRPVASRESTTPSQCIVHTPLARCCSSSARRQDYCSKEALGAVKAGGQESAHPRSSIAFFQKHNHIVLFQSSLARARGPSNSASVSIRVHPWPNRLFSLAFGQLSRSLVLGHGWTRIHTDV